MKMILVLILFVTLQTRYLSAQLDIFLGIEKYQDYYDLPDLPFSYDSMEPWIDAKTMEVHHLGHHGAYTAKMNSALLEWRQSGEDKKLSHSSIVNIIANIEKVPKNWRNTIRDNGGGYINHIFYFSTMSPNPNGYDQLISPNLSNMFRKSFHNYTHFQEWMTKDAIKLFGSGYVWLCREPTQDFLTLYSTNNQISPVSYNLQPLIVIDVWEHAYYLKNQNQRKDYVTNWWKTVDWTKVERLLNWWREQDSKHDEL